MKPAAGALARSRLFGLAALIQKVLLRQGLITHTHTTACNSAAARQGQRQSGTTSRRAWAGRAASTTRRRSRPAPPAGCCTRLRRVRKGTACSWWLNRGAGGGHKRPEISCEPLTGPNQKHFGLPQPNSILVFMCQLAPALHSAAAGDAAKAVTEGTPDPARASPMSYGCAPRGAPASGIAETS